MKKHLRLDVSGPGFYPEVIYLLRRLPPAILFHQKYPFLHPAAIYNLSIRQVAIDLRRVLADYAGIRAGASASPEQCESIAQSQRALIYSLREHIDDCQMILMCLVDPTTLIQKGKSPDEMLKAAGLVEAKIFWNGVHNYADSYLMPLVNLLKHSQGRFRTVTFECPSSDVRPGFYLEEVDGSGTASPSLKLHNGNSAFSFARDTRLNLAFVFKAAESLEDAIHAALKRLGVTPLVRPADLKPDTWSDACRQVSALGNGVSPQEVRARFVRFSVEPKGTLQIRELDRDTTLSFPAHARVQTQTQGDGVTVSFRMPYFGDNRPKIK